MWKHAILTVAVAVVFSAAIVMASIGSVVAMAMLTQGDVSARAGGLASPVVVEYQAKR